LESVKLPFNELPDSRLCCMESGDHGSWIIEFPMAGCFGKVGCFGGRNIHQCGGYFCFSAFLCVTFSMYVYFILLVFCVLPSVMELKQTFSTRVWRMFAEWPHCERSFCHCCLASSHRLCVPWVQGLGFHLPSPLPLLSTPSTHT
jgi:hypothetical protein